MSISSTRDQLTLQIFLGLEFHVYTIYKLFGGAIKTVHPTKFDCMEKHAVIDLKFLMRCLRFTILKINEQSIILHHPLLFQLFNCDIWPIWSLTSFCYPFLWPLELVYINRPCNMYPPMTKTTVLSGFERLIIL